MTKQFVFLQILLFYLANSIIWSAPDGIRTGLITPFSTFVQQNQTVNYNCSYNQSLINPVRKAAISLTGFSSSIISSSFYYITNISAFDLSKISIKVTIKTQTYLTRLNFNYIVIGDPISGIYLDLFTGCFLTTNVSSGNGTRSQTFGIQQYSSIYTGQTLISTSVSSFNISTSDGSLFQFSTHTWMINNSKTIYQKITALDYTLIDLMCLTTIIYDSSAGNSATNNTLEVRIVQGNVDWFNQTSNILTISVFQDINQMFFGISGMKLGLLNSLQQDLFIDTDSYRDLSVNFSANENIIQIQFNCFYIAIRNCTITDYYNPQDFTCVASCTPPLYALLPQKQCGLCSQTCLSCNGSLNTNCLTCNATQNRQINSTTHFCDCKPQFYEVNLPICASCNSLISGCQTCINKTHCQTCNSPLTPNSTTGKCQCANGYYLVQNTCLSYPGCISVNIVSNAVYCNQCDSSLNFIRYTSNYTCGCANNYSPINGTCQAVCGDGILSNAQCDDQNLINGDGCSSNCSIQVGWSCYYNSTLIKSVCTINTTFSLEYLYSKRNLQQNSAQISFVLTPIFKSLQKMNFSQFCSFSFSYSSLSSSYDSSKGIITFTINYLESIQQKESIVALNFDQNIVTAPSVSISFFSKGQNAFLTLDAYAQLTTFIIYGSLIISGLMWIIVIIGSVFGQKMLSIQLMLPFQLIYFFLICIDSKIPNVVALQFLKYSSGYNSLNGLTSFSQSSLNQNSIFSNQYVENFNFMMLVSYFILIFIFIMRLVQLFKYKQIKQNKSIISSLVQGKNKGERILVAEQIQCLKSICQNVIADIKSYRRFTNLALNKFLLVILCASLLLSTFDSSFISSELYLQGANYSTNLNYIACQFGLLLISLILVMSLSSKANQIDFQPLSQNQTIYGKLFIVFYLLEVVVLVVVYLTDVSQLIILNLVIAFVPLIFFLIKNPYKISYQGIMFPWLSSFVNITILTIPLVLLTIVKILPNMKQLFYLIVSLTTLGCCLISEILTIIRIVKHYKLSQSYLVKKTNLKKNSQSVQLKLDIEIQRQEPSQQIKNNLMNLKTNQQMINWEQKHQQQYQSIRMQKQETHESFKKSDIENEDSDNVQQEDLALIKKKLRADLKKKRGNY